MAPSIAPITSAFAAPSRIIAARSANVGTTSGARLRPAHPASDRETAGTRFQFVTDGEFRRGNFMSDLTMPWKGIAEGVAVHAQLCIRRGPIVPRVDGARHRRRQDQTNRRLTDHEFRLLKQHRPGDIKVTLPPPISFRRFTLRTASATRSTPTFRLGCWTSCPIIKAGFTPWPTPAALDPKSTRRATATTSIRMGQLREQ